MDYLLEGSVRRAGDRVRVMAQLVGASKQTQLWTETYERPVTDVLNIQREIADHLMRSLSIQLLPARAATAAAGPVNLESYDKYLLGLHEIGKGTREGGSKAIAYFKEALAPGIPRMRGSMRRSLRRTPRSTTYYSSPTEVMPLARDAAQRALALDPELAAAHVTLANVRLLFDWDWPAAEREYGGRWRSIRICPRQTSAMPPISRPWVASTKRSLVSQQAYRFDPLALESRNEALWIYYFSGRHAARPSSNARKTIELEPAAGLPYAMLALAHAISANVQKRFEPQRPPFGSRTARRFSRPRPRRSHAPVNVPRPGSS